MRLIDATIQPQFLSDYILERKSTFIRVLEKGDNDFLFGLLMDYFDEQPTAYDVDKVVKQLEEYGTCKDKCSNRSCCYSCKDVVIDRSDAIDIVEAGGNNDD